MTNVMDQTEYSKKMMNSHCLSGDVIWENIVSSNKVVLNPM